MYISSIVTLHTFYTQAAWNTTHSSTINTVEIARTFEPKTWQRHRPVSREVPNGVVVWVGRCLAQNFGVWQFLQARVCGHRKRHGLQTVWNSSRTTKDRGRVHLCRLSRREITTMCNHEVCMAEGIRAAVTYQSTWCVFLFFHPALRPLDGLRRWSETVRGVNRPHATPTTKHTEYGRRYITLLYYSNVLVLKCLMTRPQHGESTEEER